MTGEPESRHTGAAKPPNPDTTNPSTARSATPDGPIPPTPKAAAPRTSQRRGAPPEQRLRHWHPAVPGMGAAVPAAGGLVGGRRC
jgi:hypothetical protein